jgi:ribosomal-protein-alanine N-acetyltransferase
LLFTLAISKLQLHTAFVGFVLRPYRAADFERLWQIDQRCFPEGIAYTQMELSGFIARRNAITIVAEMTGSDGKGSETQKAQTEVPPGSIVGFGVAQPFRKTGRIITLDVLPAVRRHGLGAELIVACEDRLRERGCAEIYLETAVDNEPALKLYHKMGYTILRTLPGYYHADGLDAFLLGKAL